MDSAVSNPIKPKSNRGGKRPGAGRPKGAKDKATREQGATIGELARAHTALALDVLVQVATAGESESARVSAANALLDRGYGKAPQQVDHTGGVTLAVIQHRIVHERPDNKITVELVE